MGVDGVLDRQLVEVELAAHGVELVLARLVESEPGEGSGLLAGLAGDVQRQLARLAAPVHVDRAIEDHGANRIRPPGAFTVS